MNRTERRMFETMCKEAGRYIDPATAEVTWCYAGMDPYGIERCEAEYIGRAYFARAPGGDVWVSFGDLPPDVSEALWNKHIDRLGTPAGSFLFV